MLTINVFWSILENGTGAAGKICCAGFAFTRSNTMPDTITLISIAIAAIVGGGLVYFGLRKNLPPDAAQDLAEGVAYVKDILRGVVSEAEVKAVATWLYRNMKTGSQYYSEEQFVDLVTRAIMRGLENRDSIAAQVSADSALEATRTQARTIPNQPKPHIQRLG